MKQAKKPFEQIQKGTGVTTEQALSYNPVALNQVVSSHIPSGVMLPKTPDAMASGGGGGRVRAGGGGRVNALEIAQNRGPSFRDVISDPLLYASKAQEKLFDSVIDAGRSFIDTKAYTSEQKARAQKNEYIPEAKRPDAAKTIEGMVVKGADNFVTGITSTVDWLFGNALKEMGLEDNPISNFNAAMQANKEANEVYYGKNLANASKGLKTVESLGTEAVAAMPDLVLAFLTWGGSLAAEGAGALAKGGARLAGREAAAQTQNVIRRVAGEMYRNPQYWTSFSRVAGPSYEQAKADGANEWTANMYALTNGLLNAAVEVGGGIEVLPKALRKSENALLSWIKSNAEEGTEEVVQGVIERGLQNLIYGKNNPLVSKDEENAVFNPLTAAKEFGGGFAVGGLLSGGPALVNLPASLERGRQARALREELAKAPPVQTAQRQTLKTDAGTSTDAVRIMQKLTAGEEVTPAELETAAKDRSLVRNWLQVMGENTAEDISDADLVKALNRKAAQLQGKGEAQARSRLSEADQARYDAAKTDTARTGILAGASDENIGIAERLGQVLGRRIVFASGASTWNGSYDSGTGVITLNANSGNPVAQIIGHELTHAIEEAGESYTKLAQLVSKRLGSDLEAYRSQIRETYLQNGQELDETGLDYEMVAKYIEENLLTNEEAISSLVQEDRTLAQRIRDLLDRILAKLGNKNAQERAFIQKARDLYAQALEAAPVTSRQQIRELNDRYRRGEITEEEYDEAFDRVYDAEDALRADVQNSFAGENAKTADLEQLRTAKEMLAEDVEPETIRQQTGWFQLPNGQWSFEISDENMQYQRRGDLNFRRDNPGYNRYRELVEKAEDYMLGKSDTWLSEDEINEMNELRDEWGDYFKQDGKPRENAFPRSRLSDYVQHDELFEAYQWLKDSVLVWDDLQEGTKGKYNPGSNTITLDNSLRHAPEDEIVHEVQHLIQEEEGFPGGSSVEYWMKQGYSREEAYQKYIDTAGEIQARDAANRRNMTAEERKNTPPDTGDENTVFADGADLQYSIGNIAGESGNYGRGVVLDTNLFDGIKPRNWGKRLGEFVYKKLAGNEFTMYDDEGNPETVVFAKEKETVKKDGAKNSHKVIDKLARYKNDNIRALATVHLSELLEVSKGENSSSEHLHQWMDENGWTYRKAYIQDRKGNIYEATLNIANARDGRRILYDISNIRKIDKSATGGVVPSSKNDGARTTSHSASESIVQDVKQTVKGVPAPPKSSTLQNSFSAKPAEGVELPKVEAKTQEERLPKKAQTYLQRARRRAMEKIAYAMHIQNAESREFLKGPLTDATEEYLRSGKISEETRRKLFDAAWDEGRVILEDFYNDHKHIRDMIRTTPLNAESVKGDIADYGAFRREHMGTLRLVSNGGSNIDTFYDELHEIEPGLFPQSENNSHDRLMKILEVAQSIRKVEQSLDQHYGEEADTMRMYAENDFEAFMDELSSELRQVKRYEADKAEEEKPEPITAETVTQAYRDLKEQRRTYEKAAAKNLLTEADEVAVGRILRGEDSLDGLNPRTYNVKGIRAVVEAKREYEQTARRIREYKAQQRKARRDLADTYLGTVMGWQDKKIGAAYSRETMERNIRDIVKDKAKAQEIIDAYFTPVHTHEAAATRMKNEFRERVKGLNLSRKIADGNTVSEAHAVQLLGEAMDNMRYLEQHKRVKERDGKPYEEWQRVVNALWETSPRLNRAKIDGAVEEFRKIYDELFQQMNEVRIRNGYEPINYRQGYFPHFQPGDSSGLLEQFSRALGISADVTSLPTTINGLTHQFRPGIRWFGNAQERLGFNTTYDAVEGFDKYIEGAADVINHTDDIQNLRALSDQIRYRASDKGVREQVDRIRRMDNLTEAEKNTLINETYEKGKHHLGNFVVELEEYTNLLANKRSRRDRDMEQLLGRNMYNLAKRFESRVAANMVAINPGSWLTNFIPLTQGWTTTGSRHILQGAFETLKSFKESDGMLERSSFLTNRKGSDPLVKMWEQSSKAPTKWQKVSAFGGRAGEILSSPMEYIDQFTAGTLVRARYNQNVSRGMSEDAAIAEADAWAAGIMADRSKGSQPTVFSQQNPLKKVFTQFQLEVNNELSWLAKDVPDELKEKTLGGIALSIFKFLVGTYLFNDLYEALVGRRSALDPLGILNDTVGDLTGYQLPNLIDLARGEGDFKTTKKDLYDTTSDTMKAVSENLPFVGGVLGGGRVPISSALPNLDNLSKAVGKSGLSGKKRAQLIGKELGNTAAYVVLPFGGSQLKKAYQGVKAVAEGGSYSVDKDGNKLMQYPVYNDSTGAVIANGAKALLFGKSSLRGAREWVENDFDSFSKKETEAYQALAKDGVKQKDAYALLKKLHDVSGDDWKAQKSDIIRSSDVSDDQKQALYKTLLVTKDSKLDEKFTALRKTGMSWDQVMDTYDEYRKIKDGEGKANARATEFAVWVDENLTEKQADAVKEQFKIWQMMPANTDRYEGFTSAGINSKDAKKLTDALAALVPPEGKDQTTYLQRYEAVVKSGISASSQTEALRQLIPDTVLPKYEQTVKYNVTAEQYVKMYAATERLKQQYKKSNVNYSIAEEAINSISGLTPKQKAVLWQIQNKSWKGSKNPYDTTVGWAVYKALNNVDADGVMLP